MYVARALFKTIGGVMKGFRCFMNGVSLFNYFKSHFCVTLSHMVPSSRGKRWTIPDNSEDASAGDQPHAARTIFSNSEHQQNKNPMPDSSQCDVCPCSVLARAAS